LAGRLVERLAPQLDPDSPTAAARPGIGNQLEDIDINRGDEGVPKLRRGSRPPRPACGGHDEELVALVG
jgi:hypothetical protein